MEKMEKIGCPKGIVSFVVPIGYTFNLDGSVLYQSIAALFLAQVYHIDLTIWQQITLVLVLMVTSKGMAAVPGTSFVVLLATLGTIGVPAEVAFIAGVDRIMDIPYGRQSDRKRAGIRCDVKMGSQYDPVKGAKVMSLAKTEQNTTISG